MGVAWSSLEAKVAAPPEPRQTRLGSVDGVDVRASVAVAERVERHERLAALGMLGAGDWMDSRELLAWTRSEQAEGR
jgi:hypothetical protein